MNITKVFVYVFLIIISILSFYLGNRMEQEKHELDAAIKIGLEFEKSKMRSQLGELSDYSRKKLKYTTEKDSIIKIIDTISLFSNPFSNIISENIIFKLNRIDSSFNIIKQRGESNISFVTRSIKRYFNHTYKETQEEELIIMVGQINLKNKNTLVVRIDPFKVVNWHNTNIFFKDSLIASSSPFLWNGNPNGLHLQITNPVTLKKENYGY